MRTLVVGAGALGGLIATRLLARGVEVSLATRTAESAAVLFRDGLRVTGKGGDAAARPPVTAVKALPEFLAAPPTDGFELVILATKATEAEAIAPSLTPLLGAQGTLLPIQNGGVSQLLAAHLGTKHVLGGLSNLGATMHAPGRYEQRNDGHFLIGELPHSPAGDNHTISAIEFTAANTQTTLTGSPSSPAISERATRIAGFLNPSGVPVRTTSNMIGAIWSKLAINCAGTTIAALRGGTIRELLATHKGLALFATAYAEVLRVAQAQGITLERGLIDPYPPAYNEYYDKATPGLLFWPKYYDSPHVTGRIAQFLTNNSFAPSKAYQAWLETVIAAYGDLKPSMLYDFQQRRPTEIDYLNGFVTRQHGFAKDDMFVNAEIVRAVRAVSGGRADPCAALVAAVAEAVLVREFPHAG